MEESLNFRVSSALKSVIGKDLITSDHVAMFELVKNSYDAGASNVEIIFQQDDRNDSIYIIDNGKGMSYDDIVNKWLFVAYSAKSDGSEDNKKRIYAGQKGIGRFSCDKLGSHLKIQTKTAKASEVNIVQVDWDNFESDMKNDFDNIDVAYTTESSFALPEGIKAPSNGCVIEITGVRESWPKQKLNMLKQNLAKLINPFGDDNVTFSISLSAKHHNLGGSIINPIFDVLATKTTRILVELNSSGLMTSKLFDRGEEIYVVEEPCDETYNLLLDSSFSCEIYYLNKSAKNIFTRRMGLESVNYGSLFLFRNDFRVYPVGERGDDTWGLDARKQQGYARYLGSRDIIGKVNIFGPESKFKEATSRDKGLIDTAASKQLLHYVTERCIRRLENYVVGVNWKLPFDKDYEDISQLTGDKGRAAIVGIIGKLINNKNLRLIRYSNTLVNIVGKKSSEFELTVKNLKKIAENTNDNELATQITDAEASYQEMITVKKRAEDFAESERIARLESDKKALQAEAEKETLEKAYHEEKKRNLFLSSLQTSDQEILENLHHQIIIYASNASGYIESALMKLSSEDVDLASLKSTLEDVSLIHQQVIAASKFATKANFRLESEKIDEDIVSYIEQYLSTPTLLSSRDINIQVKNLASPLPKKFKPIELAIVFDNLISNADKASATNISVTIDDDSENKAIVITVNDDGFGVPDDIYEKERIFDKGVSTTEGSGLGLYFVKQTLEELGGSIDLTSSSYEGCEFTIRIKR